ncbi:MAG TPA: cyclic nucleotide-binding domain-containing protein [Stellaceae bacterium]|nr:cyclic nucleotide-binding domain-containing protein [Stellaceae bacterium]
MRKVLYIFGLLTDGDIEWMARTGTRRWLTANEVLIHEGRPVDSVILLLEGEFIVSVTGVGEVARLSAGEIVGEMSYVDSAPPSATVTASGKSLALFIDKRQLSRKLETDVAFGFRFYRALAVFLADRLRETVHRLGYSKTRTLASEEILEDELDIGILDNLSMAGERFHRMLKLLSGAP